MAISLQKAAVAQSLPKLPADPAVSTGVLPDGVRYFLCTNPTKKGEVSLSLVQRMDTDLTDEQLFATGRRRLSAVKFSNSSLHSFLSRNGASLGRGGIVRAERGDIEYRIERLCVSANPMALDSTVFALLSLATVSGTEGQPSSSQALVISGDINAKTLAERLKLLSIMCPDTPGRIPDHGYVWKQRERSQCEGSVNPPLNGWWVEWTSARVAPEHMPSVLPVVLDKMSAELGSVLGERIYGACHAKGLYVWVSFQHVGGDEKVGDDSYRLSVYCAKAVVPQVKDIMNTELNRLFTWGVSEGEYVFARDSFKWKWFGQSRLPLKDNVQYLQLCRNNFLHGAALSSHEQRMKSVYKDMPDSTQTRLFNNFLKELIGQTAVADYNLLSGHKEQNLKAVADTLARYIPRSSLKLPKDRNEYMTKGMIWTYSNGVNVIYRQLPTNGMLYYSYSAKGGRQYADVDYLSGLDGIYNDLFENFLDTKGISNKVEFHPTDVRLTGSVPTANIQTMLQTVVAITSQEENRKVFGPDTYKLFVMVGDIPYEKVKVLMGYYASVLGPGQKWLPGTMVEEDDSEQKWYGRARTLEYSFHINLSATNYALQNVARIVLEECLIEEFDGCAATVLVDGGFQGFPTDLYRLTIGAEAAAERGFALGTTTPSKDEMEVRMRRVVRRLATTPVDAARLSRCKARAADDFKSYKETPQYYLEIAQDRYLNNRNLTSRYDVSLRLVTPETLQNFFANAYSSNPD